MRSLAKHKWQMVHIPMKLGLHRLGTTVDHQRFLVVAIWHLFGLSRSCWYLPSVFKKKRPQECFQLPTYANNVSNNCQLSNWLVNHHTFKRLHELRSSIVAGLEKASVGHFETVRRLYHTIYIYINEKQLHLAKQMETKAMPAAAIECSLQWNSQATECHQRKERANLKSWTVIGAQLRANKADQGSEFPMSTQVPHYERSCIASSS